MNFKKGFLLFMFCGLLLASGVQAHYDDDEFDDDFDSRSDDYGPRGRPFGPEGRPDGPGDQPYGPGSQPFGPGDQPYGPGGQPYGPGDQPYPPESRFPQRYPYSDRAFPSGDYQDQGGDDNFQDNRPFDMTYLTKQANPFFDAICTAKDRCVTSCESSYQDGCICYNDGTCTMQYVNRCHQCTDPNVYAVFEGKSCPRQPYGQVCSQINQDQGGMRQKRRGSHRGSSKRQNSGLKVLCTGEKLKSCVCDLQGECVLRMLDVCDVCQSSHYSAIFLNSTCPDNSLRATCQSTSVVPALATCNNPQAYLCQDQDRTSMTCNLQSSSIACVCYSNGTCVSQPSSACECQNTNVVSVFTGSYCPTNCTANITSNEEGESSESEKTETETETKNEEAEKSEKTESEGESKNEESESKSEEESEVKSEEESESKAAINQNSTMTNLSDEFTSKNPNRFIQCDLPNAYSCKDADRGVQSCSETLVDSCVCNTAGVCISIPTNRCKACANSDVASVFENGSCSSRCQKFDAQNVTPLPLNPVANQTVIPQPVANQSLVPRPIANQSIANQTVVNQTVVNASTPTI